MNYIKIDLLMFIKKYYLKTKNIKIMRNVKFYNSIFEDNIYIYRNCDISNSSVGRGTYIAMNSNIRNAYIGRFCSIGQNVNIITGNHPTSKFVSTHPAFYSLRRQAGFTFTEKQSFEEYKYINSKEKKWISIGNDVCIGNNVTIMQGIEIGDGAIIGANAVVTKNIEPYSINVGNPAKKIRYRFSESQIQLLKSEQWWNKDFKDLYKDVEQMQDIELYESVLRRKF